MTTHGGNPMAGIDLFEAHRPAVYRWAYRIVGRHHDALDIVQDVGMRWLLARDGVAGAPTAWLRRVTINRAIDVVRMRRASVPAIDAAAPPSAEVAELDALRGDVARVLATLTDAQRSVLVAKVFDGLTFSRIAAEQGLAVPTVKTHYLRALQRMRDALQPWALEQSHDHSPA